MFWLTLLVAANFAAHENQIIHWMIGIPALLVAILCPLVALTSWSIEEDDGWWKFDGSVFAKIVVTVYSFSILNIVVALAVSLLHDWAGSQAN